MYATMLTLFRLGATRQQIAEDALAKGEAFRQAKEQVESIERLAQVCPYSFKSNRIWLMSSAAAEDHAGKPQGSVEVLPESHHSPCQSSIHVDAERAWVSGQTAC